MRRQLDLAGMAFSLLRLRFFVLMLLSHAGGRTHAPPETKKKPT
jgi:hypothetical protein